MFSNLCRQDTFPCAPILQVYCQEVCRTTMPFCAFKKKHDYYFAFFSNLLISLLIQNFLVEDVCQMCLPKLGLKKTESPCQTAIRNNMIRRHIDKHKDGAWN